MTDQVPDEESLLAFGYDSSEYKYDLSGHYRPQQPLHHPMTLPPSAPSHAVAMHSPSLIHHPHAQQQQQQSQQPFSYVPTIASTVPVHGGNTRSKMPRRRRTGSKRSLEEMILESTIPTNISTAGTGAPTTIRNGPQIGLLTGVTTSGGIMSPSLPAGGPTLPLTLPEPPLSTAVPINPNALQPDPQPRPKKKSKYSPEQDSIILRMKKEGKSWTEIAEAAKCGNSLAARNRYQVLIGQQGGGAVVWEAEDSLGLKSLLEEGERAKWDYIASELSRIRSKKVSAKSCQSKIKELFDQDPTFFGVVIGAPQLPPQGNYYIQNTPVTIPLTTPMMPYGFPPPPPQQQQQQQQQLSYTYAQHPPPPPQLPPPEMDLVNQLGSFPPEFMRRN
ncbi:hypothetical protein TRVA0_009S02344 [Trichomonascus vanleenenianus]|uniref:uncharacterized protein n=1 Tax=Trichomonascus vanleenenianus TaxID=2268995 RepID=UPI003ECB5227